MHVYVVKVILPKVLPPTNKLSRTLVKVVNL